VHSTLRIIVCGVWSWILDLQSFAQAGSSTIKRDFFNTFTKLNEHGRTQERNCKFAIQVVSSRKVIGGGGG